MITIKEGVIHKIVRTIKKLLFNQKEYFIAEKVVINNKNYCIAIGVTEDYNVDTEIDKYQKK